MIALVKHLFGFSQAKNTLATQQKLQESEATLKEACKDIGLNRKIEISQKLEYTTEEMKKLTTVKFGVITQINSGFGIIDDQFMFDAKLAQGISKFLKVGCTVMYSAFKRSPQHFPKILRIHQVIDDDWDADEINTPKKNGKESNQIESRTLVGVILNRSPDSIVIVSEQNILDVHLDTIEISFVPQEGDRVVLICNVETTKKVDGPDVESLKVLSVHYSTLERRNCTVTAVQDDCAMLDNDAYVVLADLSNGCTLNVGNLVRATLIECQKGEFVWRATELVVLKSVIPNGSTKSPTDTLNGLTNCAKATPNDDTNSTNTTSNSDTKSPSVSVNGDTYSATAIMNGGIKSPRDSVNGAKATPNGDINSANATTKKCIVDVPDSIYCYFDSLNEQRIVEFVLRNNTPWSQMIKSIHMDTRQALTQVRLIDINPGREYELKGASEFTIRFNVVARNFGNIRVCFIIQFEKFRVRRAITVDVGRDKPDEEKAQQLKNNLKMFNENNKIEKQRYAYAVWNKKGDAVPADPVLPKRRFVAQRIPEYEVPMSLRTAYLVSESKQSKKSAIETLCPYLAEELSFQNYVPRFQSLLHLEEVELFLQYRNYDIPRAHFTREGEYLSLFIEDLSERKPTLVLGDCVRATQIWGTSEHGVSVYEGSIQKVLPDHIFIKFNAAFQKSYNNEDMKMQFFFSRFSLRKQHFAVNRVVQQLGETFLFPRKINLRPEMQMVADLDEQRNLHVDGNSFKWFNSKLNPLQQSAVRNVLRGEVENMPYVIFGPPGTGKTLTVVELILQIQHLLPHARILVAAPSNSSVNLIGSRLGELKVLKEGKFIRIVSHNHLERDLIPDKLKPFCATIDIGMDGSCKDEMTVLDSGVKVNCKKKFLSKHTVTLSTCVTLGNYLLLGFDSEFFTHVIIDECGQCTESELMVVCCMVSRQHGQVVLAGDPRQLDAYLTNTYASDRGLSQSFLERVLSNNPYRKDMMRFPKTSGYDPRLVTKLLWNYRSLPSILNTFNEFFYDGELVPLISAKLSREARLLEKCNLRNYAEIHAEISHGVFFYGVVGENLVQSNCPSFYNPQEAKSVFQMLTYLYRQGMTSNNIGIISPYSRQVKHIRNLLNIGGVSTPKIGSVEEFQGQERDIILISTVRSYKKECINDTRNILGFVKCPKRMNVAISRARSLLICFGNPYVLGRNENWRKLIQYCVDHNAYWGCPLNSEF